jgi:phage head maturation protease
VILTRAVDVADLEVRSDGRTIEGTVHVYGEQAQIVEYGQRYTETFTRGAFAGTAPASVVLTATHPRSSDIDLGNEVLQLAVDRVPLGPCVGFIEVPGGSRWNHARTHVERHRAALDHVAVVRAGAYPSACVTGVRSAQDLHGRPLLLVALRRNP